jgi:hypothetical protein
MLRQGEHQQFALQKYLNIEGSQDLSHLWTTHEAIEKLSDWVISGRYLPNGGNHREAFQNKHILISGFVMAIVKVHQIYDKYLTG